MPKEKSIIIKDHEVARLASILQEKFGKDLAAFWNQSILPEPPIYDEGDCRMGLVAGIKQWRKEMGRE